MKSLKHSFLILIFINFVFISCTKEETTTTDFSAAKTELNVSYGSHSQQVFDLYLPANRNPATTKTLILVHGGGWVEGDKVDMNYAVDVIKQFLPNYAIVNMNYQLATTNSYAFPKQIDDITVVINKLKTEDYGISEKIGFIGTSAGGQLSLLYSYAYNQNNNIKMVASIVGPTNFTDPNYTNNPAWLTIYQNVTGVDYPNNISYYEDLSPFHRATATSPPTIMFYGNADDLVPTTQGQDLHAKLNELGVYNEFNLYNGGHGNWSQVDLLDANLKLISFIQNRF